MQIKIEKNAVLFSYIELIWGREKVSYNSSYIPLIILEYISRLNKLLKYNKSFWESYSYGLL